MIEQFFSKSLNRASKHIGLFDALVGKRTLSLLNVSGSRKVLLVVNVGGLRQIG